MKIPAELNTITPLSKALALIVFITLPFIGFFAGMRYSEKIATSNIQYKTVVIHSSENNSSGSPQSSKSISQMDGFSWNLFKPADGDADPYKVIYKNKHLNFSFEFPERYKVLESKKLEFGRKFEVEVMSDSNALCLYAPGNPCNITDQPLADVTVSTYDNSMNEDLTTWIKNKYHKPTDYPTEVLEYMKPVSTPYLKNGISTHYTLDIGDGSYYWYFYIPEKHMILEFNRNGTKIENSKEAMQVINSFHFVK